MLEKSRLIKYQMKPENVYVVVSLLSQLFLCIGGVLCYIFDVSATTGYALGVLTVHVLWVLVEKNKARLGKFALKWFVKCDENE